MYPLIFSIVSRNPGCPGDRMGSFLKDIKIDSNIRNVWISLYSLTYYVLTDFFTVLRVNYLMYAFPSSKVSQR